MHCRCFRFFACAAFALLYALPSFPLRADAPAPVAPAPPTLAQALAGAAPSKEELFLTVSPERVTLPAEAVPPQKDDSVSVIGQAYGRIRRDFGGVTALAPPTMTLLNTQPGTPDPYDGIPPNDALKMLLASLGDSQWKALTSETGLGASDLTDSTQRALLIAFLPSDKTRVNVQHGPGESSPAEENVTLAAEDLAAARLRLGQRVEIGLPIEGKPNSSLTPGDDSAPGRPRYVIYQSGNQEPKDRLYGATVRQAVPNIPKTSDLDFDRAALKKPIPLNGIQTVGDLLFRVGAALKVELYADRRYEKRSVVLLGPGPARARDLLRAVALCVCGTYRRVGPAYVLTDDVMGLGPRRRVLTRFAQDAATMRRQAMGDAGDKLITERGGISALPALADGMGFSDAQKTLASKAFQQITGASLEVPLAKLTPAQRALAERQTKQWNEQYDAQPHTGEDGIGRVTLDGTFRLSSQPTLLLLTAKVPGPIRMYVNSWELFQPSNKLREAINKKQQQAWEAEAKARPAPTTPPPAPPALPPLAALLARQPRRALVAAPRTAKDVDAVVAAMKTIGLNQLWLDVFSGGHSHLDGDPDILTEALKRAKGAGISVFPTLDLLKWNKDAPAGAADLTVMGETSAQASARQQHYQNIVGQNMTPEEADKQPPPPDLSADPFSAPVQATLTALIKRLAGTEGVGAIVLRETVTPGYNQPASSRYGMNDDDLGYTIPLRLALLRRDHVDPLDLDTGFYVEGINVNVSLPEFEDYEAVKDVRPAWNGLRSDANIAFLRGLLAAAQTAAGRRLPLLIKQRRSTYQGNWYGLWDDPRQPLPALPEDKANGMSGTETNFAALAHTQCRTDLFELNPWETQSKEGFAGALQALKPGWDGFVVDYSTMPSGMGSPLEMLAKSMKPQK